MHYIFQPYNYDLSDPNSIPNMFFAHLYLVGIIMISSLVIAILVGLLSVRYRRIHLSTAIISGLLYN